MAWLWSNGAKPFHLLVENLGHNCWATRLLELGISWFFFIKVGHATCNKILVCHQFVCCLGVMTSALVEWLDAGILLRAWNSNDWNDWKNKQKNGQLWRGVRREEKNASTWRAHFGSHLHAWSGGVSFTKLTRLYRDSIPGRSAPRRAPYHQTIQPMLIKGKNFF